MFNAIWINVDIIKSWKLTFFTPIIWHKCFIHIYISTISLHVINAHDLKVAGLMVPLIVELMEVFPVQFNLFEDISIF